MLDSISRASLGARGVNHAVNLLKRMPLGVSQDYQVLRDGQPRKRLQLGPKREETERLPRLREGVVRITGVTFDQPRNGVRIDHDGVSRWLVADAAQVEKAIELRNVDARAVYVEDSVSGGSRLLLLDSAAAAQLPKLNDEQRQEYLLTRWAEVLRRLK